MRPKAIKKKRSAKSKASRGASETRRSQFLEEKTSHLRLRQKSEQALKGRGESSPPAKTARRRKQMESRVGTRTARLSELNARLQQQLAERQRIEEFLRDSEERFRTFLDHAPNVAFIKTNDGRYLYVNRRFEEVFHLEPKSILGKTDGELFAREQADQFQANDRLVVEAGKAMEFEETALYTDGLHTNIVVKFPLRDGLGQVYATGGIVTDITDRKRNEEKLNRNQDTLRQQRRQLQGMTSKLLTLQEEERRRIARELHDDFSQRLAALVIDVASLEQRPPVLPELIPAALEPVREQLEQLADDVHNLAYQLHPSLLAHVGLQPAIEDHVYKVTARTGLRIHFKARGVLGSIPLDQSMCLFRILQEGLQNIAKHANATDVTVQLSGSSHGVGLSLIDNGKGFDASGEAGHPTGLGLISMQERLRILNGSLRLHSRPAGGTKLCAWIPFPEGAS